MNNLFCIQLSMNKIVLVTSKHTQLATTYSHAVAVLHHDHAQHTKGCKLSNGGLKLNKQKSYVMINLINSSYLVFSFFYLLFLLTDHFRFCSRINGLLIYDSKNSIKKNFYYINRIQTE